MAIHRKGIWDLVVVVTTKRLREIMQRNTLLTCLVDNVPGFGKVPPICLAFMNVVTRSKMTPDQIIMETTMAMADGDDYVGVLPIVFRLSDAGGLRKRKICALTANTSSLREAKVPAWGRLENIIILLADTKVEARRLLETFKRLPNTRVEETDSNDESMW